MNQTPVMLNKPEEIVNRKEIKFYFGILVIVFLFIIYNFYYILVSVDHYTGAIIASLPNSINKFFYFLSVFFIFSLISYYRKNLIQNVKFFRISFWIFVLSLGLEIFFALVQGGVYFLLITDWGSNKNFNDFPDQTFDFLVVLSRIVFVLTILYFGYRSIKQGERMKLSMIVFIETIIIWGLYIGLIHYFHAL